MTPNQQAPEPTYSINELADEAGVTRRTVHYYVAQGLLPAAGTEGPGTRYRRGHLDRLRLIRELQREHLPLSEIRQRLERLSDAQVGDLLATGEMLPEPRGTAFDYIQSILAGTSRRAFTLPQPPRESGQPLMSAQSPAASALHAPTASAPRAPSSALHAPATAAPPPLPIPSRADVARSEQRVEAASAPSQAALAPRAEPAPTIRSQWERISLGPDVELHVRRPQSRLHNRAVDRLVALARQLLEEDQP